MKLRNKTTGEIVHVWEIIIEGRAYNSLAEIKEDYEDIKPAEPLIKDEKIRKAVRAWAEVNDIRYARKCGSTNPYSCRIVGYDALATGYTIEFERHLKLYGEPDKIEKDSYTIAELCGEENNDEQEAENEEV